MTATTKCRTHDWRINPSVIYPGTPPAEQLVCATCGATKIRTAGYTPMFTDDPTTWPKA